MWFKMLRSQYGLFVRVQDVTDYLQELRLEAVKQACKQQNNTIPRAQFEKAAQVYGNLIDELRSLGK
jgi:hypothetical protein